MRFVSFLGKSVWGRAGSAAFKNNNSKRLSHVSEPEAFAKHNLIPQHLHNSTFTGTPYSERWAYHDSVS